MSSNTNPYQAPAADVNQSVETYQPLFFSVSGRIGRLRFLAYSLFAMVILIPFLALLAVVGSDLQVFISLLMYVPALAWTVIVCKRRLNDMNRSGWFSILYFLPLLNLIMFLWMACGRGTQGNNRFGARPSANPLSVKIFGMLTPLMFFGGMLAAIALPAYQDYVERAQAASERR